MAGSPRCWKCGAVLDTVPLLLSRYAECPACGTELHVCRMCRFHDPAVAKSCREPIAEEVWDKTRANFCGYLEIRADAYRPGNPEAVGRTRVALDGLFGGIPADAPETPEDEAGAAAERLFRARDRDDGE